jgi:hypothetical protein
MPYLRNKATQQRVREINRLGAEGVVNEHSATELALRQRMTPKPVPIEQALRATAEQRTAAERAREQTPMAQAINGFNRLP